jgi:hypothetical protein
MAQQATPTASAETGCAIDDGSREPNDECRSHHGNVFFGRVIDVVEVGKFPVSLNLKYVVFAVDVEGVRRHFSSEEPEGRAPAGWVQIEVDGIDLPIKNKGRTALLVVGERYLFAGMNLDKGYLVDSEVGFLPVSHVDEADRAVLAAHRPGRTERDDGHRPSHGSRRL